LRNRNSQARGPVALFLDCGICPHPLGDCNIKV
jgi:hypothetical protein